MINTPIYRGKFNVYDVFAHFLPGVVILIGLYIPIVLHFWRGGDGVPRIAIYELLALVVVAYFLGLVSQALGSMLNFGDRPFERWTKRLSGYDDCDYIDRTLLERVKDNPDDGCKTDLDEVYVESMEQFFDELPYEKPVRILGQDGNFERLDRRELDDEIDHYFKFAMSYLEASPLSRTMRVHGLHLATRGLYIAFGALTLVYAALTAFTHPRVEVVTGLQITWLDTALLMGLAAALTAVLYYRSKHYEHEVHQYIASEFVINEGLNENVRDKSGGTGDVGGPADEPGTGPDDGPNRESDQGPSPERETASDEGAAG